MANATVQIRWRGDALARDVERACQAALDETTAAAVAPAKRRTRVRTGLLQGSIQFRPSVVEGNRIIGRVGSFNVNYAIPQHFGYHTRTGRFIPGTHYMTIAMDETAPGFPDRLKQHLERIS